MKGSIKSGLMWKLLERFGVQGVQFVMQLVLARLLDPAHYGVLSLMIVFTTLANVFTQHNLNNALVQNKDVTEDDYSTVFWANLAIAGSLYALLYACAPAIAAFYEMPEIVTPFRVLALMLIPGAYNSVQLAKIRRDMDFRKTFISNIGAIVVSGVVGIILAYQGAGLWALVIQTLMNVVVACIVMCFTVRWFPRLVFDVGRLKVLFSYGWKLMVSGLIEALYQDLRSLVIGKKYAEDTLGFYNRGKQFPQFVINAINGAAQSVMLPAMSRKQDEQAQLKTLTRRSIMLCSYIVFPMMAGLAAVASPMVQLLLTDKWLPCVPYLQIYCVTFAFYPVHTCNLQAINAVGRSDIYLKLEIVKKSVGILSLVIAVVCFDSPIAIAMTGVITTLFSSFVNALPNRKLIGYTYGEQMADILPSIVLSALMFGCVYALAFLGLGTVLTLALQVVTGGAVYIALSHVFRLQPYRMVRQMIFGKRGAKKAAA